MYITIVRQRRATFVQSTEKKIAVVCLFSFFYQYTVSRGTLVLPVVVHEEEEEEEEEEKEDAFE